LFPPDKLQTFSESVPLDGYMKRPNKNKQNDIENKRETAKRDIQFDRNKLQLWTNLL